MCEGAPAIGIYTGITVYHRGLAKALKILYTLNYSNTVFFFKGPLKLCDNLTSFNPLAAAIVNGIYPKKDILTVSTKPMSDCVLKRLHNCKIV